MGVAQIISQAARRFGWTMVATVAGLSALFAASAWAQEGATRLVTTELRSNDACDTAMVGAQKNEFPVCFKRTPKTWVAVADLSSSVDLDVKFEFDSAELTPQAETVLAELAVAMNDPKFIDSPFRIEGHTDAVGSDEYNLGLSDRRAASVRSFLVSQGVGAGRLQSEGRGERQLLDPNNPTSGVNRRVRVVNLDSTS